MTTATEDKNTAGAARELSEKELDRLEQRLDQVLTDLAPVEGQLDVDSEFEKVMFSKTDASDAAIDEVREMSRRFGPRLVQLLGFPAVSGRCSIYVNDGGMRAELEIDPPASDGKAVTMEDVRRQIDEQKIIFGVDVEAISKAVEEGRTEKVRGRVIASGVPVKPARDGFIEPIRNEVPMPDVRPSQGAQIPLADIECVEKGQKIARLVEPAPGAAGKDVFGWDIPAPEGKPIAPKCGDRVSFDANAGIFYAKESGRVSILGDAIDIEDLHIIKQDVDISVGHVNFPGELVVRGWVRSGLSVQAEKDIVIEGGVEAATVVSTAGSIVIHKGVQGSGMGVVQAAWDVSVKFAEGATVLAGGILKTQSAIRSELAGGEAVNVTAGKGVVIGGKIYAGKRVEVKELGAGSGEPTVVQLGISPENLQSLSKLKNRLQAAQKAMADAELALQQSGLSSDAIQTKAVGDDGRRLMKLVKTVVVLHTRFEKLKAEEAAFLDSMKNRTDGVLDVRGRVHPGVRVQIGTASYQVTKPLSWVRFKYDKALRRIKVLPLG